MYEKICSKCKQLKSFDCFNMDNSRKDRLSDYCKQCRKIVRAAYNAKVRDLKDNAKSLMQQRYDNHNEEWLNNGQNHGQSTYRRVLKRIRGNKCECCGLQEWFGKPINLQMHHIDGNHYNNHTSNIVLLCPNCHSYTDSYCGKNKNENVPSDQEFKKALCESDTISIACEKLGVAKTGTNYSKAYALMAQ